MSEIVKTKAIVLRKLDYGDSSKIATFYTEGHGKISAIIKGAKSPKSKLGSIIDLLNLLQIVYYQKAGRDLQIVSQADLLNYYTGIKSDLDRLKIGSAILELTYALTLEGEVNETLFSGLERILNLLDTNELNHDIALLKYIIFIIAQLGYEIQTDRCHHCGKDLRYENRLGFNYEFGFYCAECSDSAETPAVFGKELFAFFNCLKTKQKCEKFEKNSRIKLLNFLEKYIIYHVPDFKGITSLKIY